MRFILFVFITVIWVYGTHACGNDPLNIAVTPLEDTYVQDTQDNFENATVLTAKHAELFTNRRSWIKFDVSSFAAVDPKLCSDYTLALYVIGFDTFQGSGQKEPLHVYTATNSWNATTLTWDTAPLPSSSDLIDSVTIDQIGYWVEIPITDEVKAVLGAGNEISFQLWGDIFSHYTFSSMEGENPPKISATFTRNYADTLWTSYSDLNCNDKLYEFAVPGSTCLRRRTCPEDCPLADSCSGLEYSLFMRCMQCDYYNSYLEIKSSLLNDTKIEVSIYANGCEASPLAVIEGEFGVCQTPFPGNCGRGSLKFTKLDQDLVCPGPEAESCDATGHAQRLHSSYFELL